MCSEHHHHVALMQLVCGTFESSIDDLKIDDSEHGSKRAAVYRTPLKNKIDSEQWHLTG